MITMLLPELRSYVEQLLDEALARAEMTIRQRTTREWMLSLIQEELVHFVFTRLMTALSPFERGQFVALLEHGASDETLQDFTERHLTDVSTFVAQVLLEFRTQFLHQRKELF